MKVKPLRITGLRTGGLAAWHKLYQKQALINANNEIARLRAIIKALEASQGYSVVVNPLGNAYYRSMRATDTLD